MCVCVITLIDTLKLLSCYIHKISNEGRQALLSQNAYTFKMDSDKISRDLSTNLVYHATGLCCVQ